MGKRQDSAQQTKARLIAAAEKLIGCHGFEGVTVDDIAQEAGVAKGTFYTYFRRKEDVVGAIYYHNFDLLREQALTMQGLVYDKLAWFLTKSMEYITETGLKISQQWLKNSMEPSPEGQGDFFSGRTKLRFDWQVIGEILAQGVARGEISPNAPLAELEQWIAAEYYGVVLCWCIMEGEIEPISLLRGFCQIQLKNSLTCYQNTK